jgi:protein O-GlcNAc transferase
MLDPLLAGCPAVAWQGGTFRSGMGAAMLRTLGLEDCIAHSREEYIRIATELAITPERRAQVRRRLQAEDACRPFLDTRASSRRWGDALASLCRERGIA